MIIAIDIPEGTKVKRIGNRMYLTLDTNKTKTDLWKSALYVWVTEGKTPGEFGSNPLLSSGRMEVSYSNRLKFSKVK